MDSSSHTYITCNGNQSGTGPDAAATRGNSIPKTLRCTTQTAMSSSSSPFRSPAFTSSTYTDNPSLLSSAISSPQFNGIPFSWEQSPGIPKDYPHSSYSKSNPASTLSSLPLPPLTGRNNSSNPVLDLNVRKQSLVTRNRSKSSTTSTDPFVAALVKCSTTEHRRGYHPLVEDNCQKSRVMSRTLSDRFGFIDMSMSCIRSCDVLVPKSTRKLNGSRPV